MQCNVCKSEISSSRARYEGCIAVCYWCYHIHHDNIKLENLWKEEDNGNQRGHIMPDDVQGKMGS